MNKKDNIKCIYLLIKTEYYNDIINSKINRKEKPLTYLAIIAKLAIKNHKWNKEIIDKLSKQQKIKIK